MFIDIHAHAYRNCPPFVVQFCTAEQVLQRYDEAGIEKGALLPIVSPEIYLPQANEDILEISKSRPCSGYIIEALIRHLRHSRC